MTDQGDSKAGFPIWKAGLLPQEETLEIGRKAQKLSIGIPKENHSIECRVPLTPEAVEILVAGGHEIFIEEGAGKGANYSDTDYSERGGVIVSSNSEIFKCDIILKIEPLTLNEIDLLRGQQMIFSSLPFAKCKESYYRKLMAKRITAVSLQKIRDEEKNYPIVHAMAEISGKTAVLMAANYLSLGSNGKGVLLGGLAGITPTEVMILGAGYAAESAVRAALGLGALVKVFDNSVPKLRILQDKFGANLFTSIFHPKVVAKSLKSAEVLIAAMQFEENKATYYVTEEMVKTMKKGTVIIDVSIDEGMCIETSELRTQKSPDYTKHGVVHCCVPNLPSLVSRTASIALSNYFTPMLQEIGEMGGISSFMRESQGFRKGIYIYNGILTNSYIGNFYDIPFKDIDLLMAAF